MAEPLKNLINPEVVAQIAHHLQRHSARFDRQAFEAQASAGLDGLELKARVMQVAYALVDLLPSDTTRALKLLQASLGPPGQGDELDSLRTTSAGLAGWAVWPLTEAVALLALPDHPEQGLATLHAMTQRLTAEFAIRPFIVAHPELCFATLARWAHDPSAHVRRLVSEGSRPRLPWGLRLKALVVDPSPTLPLLSQLQDDPSAYVRRSVANHLNDIAKDHPDVLVAWLAQHLPKASDERRALLRHASRGLIKAGHPAVLTAWGQGRPLVGQARLGLAAKSLLVGESLGLQLQLRSTAQTTQHLVVDYAVHHAKAAGHSTAKVFKGWVVDLAAGESRGLARQHSFRRVTVRRYHPGPHAIDVRVNGQVVAHADFELLPD